ncbi:MAG: hypothetical protein ACFFB5_07520 [Promethearchaeota archaeon]
MIENKEGSSERKLPNILNSLRIYAITTYLLYLTYTIILFVCFDMLFNNPLTDRMWIIRNFYTQLISNLPLILLVISLTAFIGWILPFRRKFMTRFYEEEMKTIWPGYSYYNAGQSVDIGLFVIFILFLPVYIIARSLLFKATANQKAARKVNHAK